MNSNEHASGAGKDMETVSGASSTEQSGSKLPHSKLFYGPQPLDAIMEDLGLKNHDLVAASTDGLTHKQVKKGRNGRRITRNIQDKITVSICAATGNEYNRSDLFTYI